MSAYRLGWLIATATLGLVGMLAAAHLSWPNVLGLFTSFALVGVVIVLLRRLTNGPQGLAHDALRGACMAGSSAVAFAGMSQIMGATALLLVLLVTVTSPWAVGAIRRWLRALSSPTEGQVESVVRALACATPGLMPFPPLPAGRPTTDEQLCQAWCASYQALEASASHRKHMRIVEARGSYLDELERRNPAAFAGWLASGATPAENPWPYLRQAHDDRKAINWDDLIGEQDW